MVNGTLYDNASSLFWSIFADIFAVDVSAHDSLLVMVDNYSTYLSIIRTVKQLADEGLLLPLEAETLIYNAYKRINHMFYVYSAV